jgi:hypothetical protein
MSRTKVSDKNETIVDDCLDCLKTDRKKCLEIAHKCAENNSINLILSRVIRTGPGADLGLG